MALLLACASIELFAIAVWLGGLVALGAIAAPTIFGIVPMPASADAMAVVFRRFDRVAVASAVIVLGCEAILLVRGGRPRAAEVGRSVAALLAAGCAVGEAAWVSPAIESLHRNGAVRGVGASGLALARTHRLAETLGKSQLGLLCMVLALVVVHVARRSRARAWTLQKTSE